MNKINKFKTNRKTNRMTNWFSPVTTSFGVAAVTTLIAMTPFQTVSAAVPDSGMFDPRNLELSFYLIPGSNDEDATADTSCFVKVYKAYERSGKDQGYCFTPRMAFVLNPKDSSIVQGVSKDIKFDGTTVVRASFKVETYNPGLNKQIASYCLMHEEFRTNTNKISFSPAPVKSVSVKVVGSDGTTLAIMDQKSALLNDMPEYPFHLDFHPDKYDQFSRDLEDNTVHFEFTLGATNLKYDTIDIEIKAIAGLDNAFKSLLGSKKEFLLDQDSFRHLTSFVNMYLDIKARSTDPKYLSNIGVRESIVMNFVKSCFDVIIDDPNADWSNAEILKVSEVPMSVISSQDGNEENDVYIDKEGRAWTKSKGVKGGHETNVAFVNPNNGLGFGAEALIAGDMQSSNSGTSDHQKIKGLKISHEEGKSGQDVDRHSYIRLSLRDNSRGVNFQTRQNIELPLEIDEDQVTVISYPAITHDNVKEWADDFKRSQITEYEADFESKRSELLKKYAQFKDNNNQIETLKKQVKSKIDTLTSLLENTHQGTPLALKMENEINTLLSDGVWESLNIPMEAPKDSQNIAARFKKAVAGLNNVEVRLSDKNDKKEATDYDLAIRSLKRFKPSKDPLVEVRDINKQSVLLDDLSDRLEILLGDEIEKGKQIRFLEDMKDLNKKLTVLIASIQ